MFDTHTEDEMELSPETQGIKILNDARKYLISQQDDKADLQALQNAIQRLYWKTREINAYAG